MNSLMPLSAVRYNQSAEVMGLRAPQRLHTGLNMADPKHKANPLFPAMEYRSMDKASLLVHCLLQSESPNREDAIRVRGMQKQISQSDWVARHVQIKPKICKRGIPISCDCIKNSSNLNCSPKTFFSSTFVKLLQYFDHSSGIYACLTLKMNSALRLPL